MSKRRYIIYNRRGLYRMKQFYELYKDIDVLIVSRVTNYRSVDYSTIKNFVFNVTKDIRMTDIPTLKQKLEQ